MSPSDCDAINGLVTLCISKHTPQTILKKMVYLLQIIKKLEIVRSVVVVSGRGIIFVRIVGLSVKRPGSLKFWLGCRS